jgi:8-oxo-dGTP pyrophosphatase MutT (NUDIX family)
VAVAEPLVRRAARVILIDGDDRVLLLAARDPADRRVVWFMPGGGVEPGETLQQAARRELAEEVPDVAGLPLVGPVWTRRHAEFSWDGQLIDQSEWFFVARLDAPLDAARIGPAPGDEGRYFVGARWSSVDDIAELVAGGEIVAPRRLAELLPPILRGELPTEPIDTGV